MKKMLHFRLESLVNEKIRFIFALAILDKVP
jgi:hypothetical protein